jgi:hypothetical protein
VNRNISYEGIAARVTQSTNPNYPDDEFDLEFMGGKLTKLNAKAGTVSDGKKYVVELSMIPTAGQLMSSKGNWYPALVHRHKVVKITEMK